MAGHLEGFYDTFVLILSNLRQSQLNVGIEFILVVACIVEMRLNFAGTRQKQKIKIFKLLIGL